MVGDHYSDKWKQDPQWQPFINQPLVPMPNFLDQISRKEFEELRKQVEDELAARKTGTSVTLDSKLLDPARVFVMSSNMTVVTADQAAITCDLSSGDVLSLSAEGVSQTGETATY